MPPECVFLAGYPITPSTEIAEQAALQPAPLRRTFHSNGGRDFQHGGRDRRFCRRSQVDDRHIRSRLLAEAGEYRRCVPCRNSLRNRGCTAQRVPPPDCPPLLPRETICRLAGAPTGTHPMIALSPLLGEGMLRADGTRLQSFGEDPHAGHPSDG